jgi:hypothetical protein
MAEIRIDVKIEGLGEVERVLDRAERALTPPELTDSLGAGADAFVKSLRSAAPERSGRLVGSIDKTQSGPTAWRVGPDVVYDRIQDQGGTIRPHNKFLKFTDGGGDVFLRSLRITGQHYMDAGFEQGIDAAVEAVAEDIFRKITG